MLVLTQGEVRGLLDLDLLIDSLERAFVELSAGRASVPPRTAALVQERALLGAMPGYLDGVRVMDGTAITAVRTGAASAVATRALAREDARVLAVLGAGVQSRSHVDAVGRVRDLGTEVEL